MYRAAEKGHKDVLLLLMGRGAQPDEADKYGQTPLHGAALNGHLEVVKLLGRNSTKLLETFLIIFMRF